MATERTWETRHGPVAVRKFDYAASAKPWRVVHVATGRVCSLPQSATLHDGRAMPFGGPCAFYRKRDAVAFLDDPRNVL